MSQYSSDIFKANKLIDNFAEILYNIFMPLFEVTKDPSSHPYLHKFLFHVIIFVLYSPTIQYLGKLLIFIVFRFQDLIR